MRFIAFAVRRPVTTLMFYVAVSLLGLVSFRQLSIDLLPGIRYPRLSVIAHCPGAAPEDMEALVTAPLEAAFSGIPDVSRLESVSREGASFMTLEFPWGTDMDFARLHAREKIDALRDSLPEDVRGPVVTSLDPGEKPIMVLAVSGDRDPAALREFAEELIKPRLEQASGVASADIGGGVEREIHVDVDPLRLAQFDMTLEDIAAGLESFNSDLPGGTLRKGQARHSLRISGEFGDISEIAETRLKTAGGFGAVRLKDLAVIRDSIKERLGMTRLNGRESIGVLVRKEAGANTVEAARAAKKEILRILAENPFLEIRIVSEQSKAIETAVAAAKEEIAGGAVLAFLVLFLFLREFRTPLIIGIVMPMSILATFNLLYFLKVTLNIMSLGGLALGVGMLDDCAVVVSENIFRRRRLGMDTAGASVAGAAEVATAVMSAALTTVVVFLPVIYVRGAAGQLFKDAAMTVTCSLLASLVVSLTLLPMLASRRSAAEAGKEADPGPARPGTPEAPRERSLPNSLSAPARGIFPTAARGLKIFFRPLFAVSKIALRLLISLFLPFARAARGVFRDVGDGFDSGYEKFVRAYLRALFWSLENKGRVIMASAAFFGLTALAAVRIDRELMPRLDSASFELRLKTPPEYSLEQTSSAVSLLEESLSRQPAARLVYAQVGVVSAMEDLSPETSLNSAKIHVESSGPREIEKVIDSLRADLSRLPEIGYSYIRDQSVLNEFLASGGPEISYHVKGNDLRQLREIAGLLAFKIGEIQGTSEARADISEGKPEVIVTVKSEALAASPGLSAGRIGDFFVDGVRGKVATRFREIEKKTDVRVRFDPKAASDLESLLNTYIPVRGTPVPLRSLVRCEIRRGPGEIRRVNQQREVLVTARLRGLKLGRALPDIEKKIKEIPLPTGCQIVPGGEQEEMTRSHRSLIFAFLLAVLLNYMIMAAQFESLRHPLLILSTVPMGLSGSVWIMLIAGQTLNIVSLIGMIILLGIIVDNAIVKVDCMNRLRKRGAGLREAIVEGSHLRLRPILMSTLTTLAGLVPMSLGLGRGAGLLRPLGIVVVGGLAFSTFLTLFLIPVIYEAVEAKARGTGPEGR